MFLVYYLSVGVVGSFTVEWVAEIFESLGKWVGDSLTNVGISEWVISLVVDGIIAGVGAVLGFIPQLIILFISISIMIYSLIRKSTGNTVPGWVCYSPLLHGAAGSAARHGPES